MQVDLTGPAGRLEGLYEEPRDPEFGAVVCHPHPLFGGTMHNSATYRLAKAVLESGGASLRFNFRGVGRSQGEHDGGRGEADDTRAALAWLAARRPGPPRYACGFSFGSWMALRAGCADPEVQGILAAGVATRSFDLELLRQCPKPVAVVQAENDEFGPVEEVKALVSGSTRPRRLAVVPETSHLFTEDLLALQRQATAALAWLREEPA